ncbi:MAG: hypothetical protein HY313_00955 [Acidobacteria bacterium]|nr:hypothetical protein [Acidobacteriota bacterium]
MSRILKRRVMGAIWLVVLSLPRFGFAQGPAMTTVRDTVYKSDGSLASGTVVITWRPFVTADNKPVFGGSKTVPLSNGSLAVALVPNVGGTPSGTSYNVKYYQSGSVFSEETWVVPSSNALSSPDAPIISNAGAPGTTTYYYWVSAANEAGETLLGLSAMTATSNSTLDGTNYNEISWNAVSGAASYRVWRTSTSTAPSGTGNYLVGETSATSINDQSNSLQQATVPFLNDTDPRLLADVRVTSAPSSTVTLAASQVNGTAIVSNPSATQSINAPPKAGVIPLQIKGQPQANANTLEIYDSQASPALQSYFNPQGALVSHQPLTADHVLSGLGDHIVQGGAPDASFTTISRLWLDAAIDYNPAFAFKSLNPPSTHPVGGVSLVESNSASAQYLQGFSAVGVSNHSTGTRPSASGMEGVAIQNGGGTITDLAGGYYRTDTLAGTSTNTYGVLIDGNTNSGGTVTNNYGLKILNQTVGNANYAIQTGLGKVQFGDDVIASTINNVRYADQFPGANAGAKIAAAIADLPSTGGTVDARGFEATQTVAQNIFSGVTKPVNLHLGCATYQISAVQAIATANVKIVGEPCTTFQAAAGLGSNPIFQTISTDTQFLGRFVIDGNSIAVAGIQVNGASADRILVSGPEIKNTAGATNWGIWFTNTFAGTAWVNGETFIHNAGHAIAMEGAAGTLMVSHVRIQDATGMGVRCIRARYCQVASSLIDNPTDVGIYSIFSDDMNVHNNR